MTEDSGKKRPGVLRRAPLGVQSGTISKVAAQIAAAENATQQEYELRQVPLADIQLWEDQPRTFRLTLDDIYRGYILDDDQDNPNKLEELEGIITLAMSLKEYGLINPPIAFALPGKQVQLMGGQRRTMAAIFALFHLQTQLDEQDNRIHELSINPEPDLSRLQLERITVKVFLRKPQSQTVERLGIIDNVQRDDLSIGDKLRWLMKFAAQQEEQGRAVRWRDLVDTLGLSRSQAYEWITVVQIRNDEHVQQVIQSVIKGNVSFAKLLEFVKADSQQREQLFKQWFGERGIRRNQTKISLGQTSNLNALRSLVLSNVDEEQLESFTAINWEDPKSVKKAFAAFLDYWVEKHG
ncbi:ParB N-terminal domain-containing protein (plasmid) [Methylomonas sp. MS20]|uniref:ParB N-terminal domain-containing protein n=1 Tax=Methylomonas sp. MS20 TaxID=3418769 RepID=UPI003D07DE7D